MKRSCGILLHPTSLPGPEGIGTLGHSAYRWIDRLEAAGVRWWQILPLGPTGFGHSPYQCYSAFAGEPLLIDLQHLVDDGLLSYQEALPQKHFNPSGVHYEAVVRDKTAALSKAFERFRPSADYDAFLHEHRFWLEDYALFMALLENFNGKPWTAWPEPVRLREPDAVTHYHTLLKERIAYHRFVQYIFFKQWNALHEYAKVRGVGIFGDLPIYVAENSADVWSHPEYFLLDATCRPTHVAGVPPDYFSETGQRWGNPVFDWQRLEAEHFDWWVRRLRANLEMYDIVRIDHFRGFEAYWSIPADEETAVNGEWIEAPGDALFKAFQNALGSDLPIIAEDLGIITPEVEKLRDDFGLPGMRILQFAFGGGSGNPYLPHNHIHNCVVYTGTHDNDTTNGWFYALEHDSHERRYVLEYLHCDWHAFHEHLIRAAVASPANLAVIPMQDLLGLGRDARMNTPGTVKGNWQWRLTEEQFHHAPFEMLEHLCKLYGR